MCVLCVCGVCAHLEDPRARKPWPGEKGGHPYDDRGGPRSRRHRQDDRQEESDYDYRRERYSSSSVRDPYYSHYHEPYERAYERRYEPQGYERGTYERSPYERGTYDRSYERGGYDRSYERGNYRGNYERYPTEKASSLDRYNLYPASPPSSSKSSVHDRDYFAGRDPYRSPTDRRWEERVSLYDQYVTDYYAGRSRGADYASREEAYYSSSAARDDPYDPPRHDPYEQRPYDQYASATYDRRY